MIETKMVNSNLSVLCQEAQELILKGYRFKEGYPLMMGWQYEAVLEKIDVPVVSQVKTESSGSVAEVPKQVGRPKSK